MKRLIVLMLFAATAIVGCGGGGSSSSTSTPPTVATASSVTADLVTTNLNSSSFPWNMIADGKLKRWSYETGLIPVKTNGSTQATYALDLIEATLGKTIFDRTSIANTADSSITSGLIVSMGTAVDANGQVTSSACGVVSSAPSVPTISGNIIDANGKMNAKLYVNIGSSACTADLNQIATHEFGHAIGLGSHFTGFGIGDIISGNFWNIVKTIYNNPIGSTVSTINVYTGVIAGDPSSGTISPATGGTGSTPLVFTSSMLVGHTASVTATTPYTLAFSSTGNTVTLTRNSTQTAGTWVINPAGTLTVTFPTDSLTYTITAINGSVLTVTDTHATTPTVIEGPDTMTIN